MSISLDSGGRINVHWVQNGIKNKKAFKQLKEAEKYQEVIEEVQNSIKLAEEFDRFNRDFTYDPDIIRLKIDAVEKEVFDLKERIRVKQALHKKFSIASHKLATQPRNVIGRDEFLREIHSIRVQIKELERFFREHAIVSLQKSLIQVVGEMKRYYHLQRESVKETDKLFNDIKKEVIDKFGSITTTDKVLDINEVSEYLKISRYSITKMMYLEKLPFVKIGNRYRVREQDLKRWIDKRSKAGN